MDILSGLAKFSILIVIALVSQSSAIASDAPLPRGWRLPSSSQINDDWRVKDIDKYAQIRADFNGDGVDDEAKLLVSNSSHGWGLFVFLSRQGHSRKTFRLSASGDATLLSAMGIAKVLPGAYAFACGKGYWKCAKGEVPKIRIEQDAISFFQTEGATSFFYWDNRVKTFRRIWISD